MLKLEEPPLLYHGVTASNMPCTDIITCFENLTDDSGYYVLS